MKKALNQCRLQIDQIDHLIVDQVAILVANSKEFIISIPFLRSIDTINKLLNKRATIVNKVAEYKSKNNMDVIDIAREKTHTEDLVIYGLQNGVPCTTVTKLMNVIYKDSRNAQASVINQSTDTPPLQTPPIR